jgi:hypothetical protein
MRSGIDPKKVTGFASWLKGKLGDAQSDILTPSEQAFLEDSAAGANHYERIAHLHQNYAKLEAKSQKQFEMLMEDLGTYYIAYERNQKKNDRPLDPALSSCRPDHSP